MHKFIGVISKRGSKTLKSGKVKHYIELEFEDGSRRRLTKSFTSHKFTLNDDHTLLTMPDGSKLSADQAYEKYVECASIGE